MMFALITEGISEHRIIKHVLQKYFKEQEPEVNQVQPKVSANKQEGTGGWSEVLNYCSDTEKLKATLVENDYLVIQIDTDQSQTPPFNVSHIKPINEEKTVEELHTDVVIKLIGLIPSEILTTFSKKILVAICVHTIECWLLPIYYSNNHKSAIKNCIPKLNIELSRHNQDSLPTATKDKNNHVAIRAYDAILKNWKRRQDIETAALHNAGFRRFIEALKTI